MILVTATVLFTLQNIQTSISDAPKCSDIIIWAEEGYDGGLSSLQIAD